MSLNLSKPAGIKLTILATDQLIAKMPKIEQLAENIMIIFGNTHETRRFIEAYPKVKEINYGGIIKKPVQSNTAMPFFDRCGSRRCAQNERSGDRAVHAAGTNL